MKGTWLTVGTLFAVGLLIYIYAVTADQDMPPIGSEAEDIKQMVHHYSTGKLAAQSASITSRQLILSDNRTYELPEDEFFVAVAPFVDNTHPCAVHNLTGCRGEMANESFTVRVEDRNGKTIIDETMKSQPNGFIDLWLPRNEAFRITVEQAGKTAEARLSTFEDDNTCITTMQLKEAGA